MGGLCRGVSELHENGIFHGDILNPRNLMMKKDKRGNVTAKIIDFGPAWVAPEGGKTDFMHIALHAKETFTGGWCDDYECEYNWFKGNEKCKTALREFGVALEADYKHWEKHLCNLHVA